MKSKKIDNAKTGLLVIGGLAFLILMLYMIGRNRNLLGTTFTVTAALSNVNGLVAGNNVRFKGIDVGTVKSIAVASDSVIHVVMTIDQKMRPYIRKNAIVTITTDGLMGNKLVNINSSPSASPIVENGDVLQSRKPVETDEMLRTLNTTNNNIEKISTNLYEITVKLNSSESLWALLSDTVITKDLKKAVYDFRVAGGNTVALTENAKNITQRLEHGNGLANRLFTDTTLSNQLASSLEKIEAASRQTSAMMKDMRQVVDDIKGGKGAAGLILGDTLLRQHLLNSALNVEQGTSRFNQNMEALKGNFLFRRYFRKIEKHRQDSIRKSTL